MFDEMTEDLCLEIRLTIALPSNELRHRVDSKIETTRIGNEAGVNSAPNVIGWARTYAQLTKLANSASMGKDLMVQTHYGDSGRSTFISTKKGLGAILIQYCG